MSVLHPNYLSITGLAISTCTLLFAGVSGAIGTIISINDDSYAFFHAIGSIYMCVMLDVIYI